MTLNSVAQTYASLVYLFVVRPAETLRLAGGWYLEDDKIPRTSLPCAPAFALFALSLHVRTRPVEHKHHHLLGSE
jgi:hypothetical protein